MGGKSLIWSAHAFRFSAHDFANARKMGAPIDWPISYEDVKPYYERVENLIGMAGSHNHPNVPGEAYMKDIGLRCCDAELKKGLAKLRRGDTLFPIPKAIVTEQGRERPQCVWCGGDAAHCYIEKLGSPDDVYLRSCRLIRGQLHFDGPYFLEGSAPRRRFNCPHS